MRGPARFPPGSRVGGPLVLSDYRRIAGSPIQSTYDLLQEFYEAVPENHVEGIRVTGSGSRTIAKILGLFFENEFKAIARMMGALLPAGPHGLRDRRGELEVHAPRPDGGEHRSDYDRSGECAAGTGSFLDQQALRMQYSVEEVGAVVCTAGRAARIAGRCSVFAKSDMIHAQQKGYSPAEILRGLCDAVARNFKSSIVKGRPVEGAGGADRRGVAERRRRRARCARRSSSTTASCSCPSMYAWCGAIGTAILEAEETRKRVVREIHRLRQHDGQSRALRRHARSRWRTWCSCATACRRTRRRRTTSRFRPTWASTSARSPPTWWSSTSSARVIHDVYLRTAGRPIEAVQQGLAEVERLWGDAADDPRRGHHRLRPRADRGVRGRRRR